VLADEPTGALDEATADLVLGLLFEAVVATRAALVVVTHDDRVAARADVNLRLQAGTVTPW
jgi:putative ABC transport system ATP-binding protein